MHYFTIIRTIIVANIKFYCHFNAYIRLLISINVILKYVTKISIRKHFIGLSQKDYISEHRSTLYVPKFQYTRLSIIFLTHYMFSYLNNNRDTLSGKYT